MLAVVAILALWQARQSLPQGEAEAIVAPPGMEASEKGRANTTAAESAEAQVP